MLAGHRLTCRLATDEVFELVESPTAAQLRTPLQNAVRTHRRRAQLL